MSPGLLLAEANNPREIAARVFLCIAIVVVVGRLVGALFRRLGQPAVLGEILAGIALGPSLLGIIGSDLPTELFPEEIRPYLRVVSELGLVVFMFIVGLEVDPAVIKRSGRKAVIISVSSILVPLSLGMFVLTPYLYGDHKLVRVVGEDGAVSEQTVERLPFALFIGVAMCVTAFPILARILTERRMFRIPLGMLLISAAAADDVIAFALLTVTLSVSGTAEHSTPIPVVLALLAAFIAVLVLVVRPLLDRFVIASYRREKKLRPDHLAILLGCVVASAYATFKIMDTSLIGPFLLGALLPRREVGHLFEEITERVEGISVTLLLPVFFVVTGLGVDVKGLGAEGIVPAVVILLVACVGKFAGAGIAARAQGVSTRQSLAIGTMMNTRGLAELVILGIARDRHILDDQLYTMLVIMTVVTTVMAGPLLKLVYPDRWLEHDIAEAERQRLGLAKGFRTMVVVADPAEAGKAVELAIAATGSARPADVLLTHLPAARSGPAELGGGLVGGLADLSTSFLALAEHRRRVEAAGLVCTVTSRLSADPPEEILEQCRAGTPDLVVVDWTDATAASARRLFDAGSGIVALLAGPRRSGPPDVPVVRAESGRDADAAVELAARLAIGARTPVWLESSGAGRSGTRVRRELDEVGVAVEDAGPLPLLERIVRPSTTELVVIAVPEGGITPLIEQRLRDAMTPVLVVRGPEREHTSLAERLRIDASVRTPFSASALSDAGGAGTPPADAPAHPPR